MFWEDFQELLKEKEAEYKAELQEKEEEIKELRNMLNEVKDIVRYFK